MKDCETCKSDDFVNEPELQEVSLVRQKPEQDEPNLKDCLCTFCYCYQVLLLLSSRFCVPFVSDLEAARVLQGDETGCIVAESSQSSTAVKFSSSKRRTRMNDDISFRLDLVTLTHHHLSFLAEVNLYPDLYERSLLTQAINRYEKFWLPLAAQHSEEPLAAPLDIEWVWHCHMLTPIVYHKDSQTITGRIVDHKIMSPKQRQMSLIKSHEIWCEMYPSQTFEVELSRHMVDGQLLDDQISSNDFSRAIAIHKKYFYQVSLPHYRDQAFLESCLDRYKGFLCLKKLHLNKFLQPYHDIDLLWHTHQLHPLIYKEDTKCLLGKFFNHPDIPPDYSYMDEIAAETQQLWLKAYGEGLPRSGSTERGAPPDSSMYRVSFNDIQAISGKSIFEGVRLDRNPSACTSKGRTFGCQIQRLHKCIGHHLHTAVFQMSNRMLFLNLEDCLFLSVGSVCCICNQLS